MVDSVLLEQVLNLDEPTRRELRDAIDESLTDRDALDTLALLKQRIAEADTHPHSLVPLDEDERELRARRRRAA